MKLLRIIILILVMVCIASCSNSNEIDEANEVGEIYMAAFEVIINQDTVLNEGAKYIAIDTNTLVFATEEDIKFIFESLKVYNNEIIYESMQTLEDKEMFIDDNYIEGFLLEASDLQKIDNNKAVLKVSKFKSRKGAVGATITLKKKDGVWTVTEIEDMWES